MSVNKQQATGSGAAADIQWPHALHFGGKSGKASGIKIEYSMSDEMEFARKLAIDMRRKLMRQLLLKENEMFQQELTRIGLLHAHDTVCEEIRVCNREGALKKSKYNNINETSSLSKLFKMLENSYG